jgi:hypothetical protein
MRGAAGLHCLATGRLSLIARPAGWRSSSRQIAANGLGLRSSGATSWPGSGRRVPKARPRSCRAAAAMCQALSRSASGNDAKVAQDGQQRVVAAIRSHRFVSLPRWVPCAKASGLSTISNSIGERVGTNTSADASEDETEGAPLLSPRWPMAGHRCFRRDAPCFIVPTSFGVSSSRPRHWPSRPPAMP